MSEPTINNETRGLYKPRMTPNIPGKLKYGRTFLIGLAFMMCSIFWEYYNFMMPILLKEHFTEMGLGLSDTLIGVVMVLDNIVAIFLLPYFGALSDRTKSKYGKRSPYLMIGVASAVVAFSVIGLISGSRGVAVFIVLIAVIMWFNISMAFYRTAAVSLMPDLTEPKVRPTGNAIINLMGAASMIIGLGIVPLSAAIFPTDEDLSRAAGFFVVSILTGIVLVIYLLTIKETPTGDKFFEIADHNIAIDPITLDYLGEQELEKKEPLLAGIKKIFTDDDKSSFYMLMVIFSWFFGFNALRTFFSLFATYSLGLTEGAAGTALMLAPGVMILFAIFAGKIAEKFGRKRTIFIGLIGLTICMILMPMPFMTSLPAIMALFGTIGIFYGMININTIVIMWEKAPKGMIGALTGAYYLFSQLSDTLSPVIAGGVFDLYRLITDCPDGEQYNILFYYAIFFELLAMFFLTRVKGGEAPGFEENPIEEN
ncbi:MAG: MFS transporter [Promethearchaeota archaeon]